MEQQLQQYRERAMELLCENLPPDEPAIIDYQIDDYLRIQLGLPARPTGGEPYSRWMTDIEDEVIDERCTSRQGIELIKSHEGLRLTAYKCPGNVWTIGYGHTSGVAPGMIINEARAEALLQSDLEQFENAVNNLVEVPINQHQFDALVSFTFNVGIGAFVNSTLLTQLNNGNYAEAANQFSRWVYGGGKKLPGLVRRRQEEASLFLS